MIRDLVKELRIFERNKVPEEIILGIAIYFQTSSFRRTARIIRTAFRFIQRCKEMDKEDRRGIAYCYREKA